VVPLTTTLVVGSWRVPETAVAVSTGGRGPSPLMRGMLVVCARERLARLARRRRVAGSTAILIARGWGCREDETRTLLVRIK